MRICLLRKFWVDNATLGAEETIRAAVEKVVPARKRDKLAGNLRALELGMQD